MRKFWEHLEATFSLPVAGLKFASRILIVLVTGTMLAAEGDGTLTLREALSRAVCRNPQLATIPFDVRMVEARILQAGLRPNPEVSLEVEDFGGQREFSGFGESETTLKFSQLVELGNKRAARVREARMEKAVKQFDYEAKRLEVLNQTAQTFFEVLGAQERVQLSQELTKLAEELMPTVQKRIEAGKASLVEQTRNDVVVASTRMALEQAKGDLAAGRRKLAAMWGARQPDFGRVTGNLERVVKPLPLADYVRQLPGNPSLARWQAETNRRRATVDREKAEGAPDVTLTAGPRWWEGPQAVAAYASISVPLPLQNRNQGAIQEAQAHLEKIVPERKAAEVALVAEISEVYEQMTKAYSEVQILASSVLPSARRTVNAVDEGYALGKLSQLDVLEARRTITEARTQYLQALVAYHKASAQLDALTGAIPTASFK